MKELHRYAFGVYPTPFYKLETISARYGKNIYTKRDDMCGVALGGNKVRKLEYLLAEAKESGCDVVFTTGGPQSNHAMLTAACAARLGMRCILLLTNHGVTDRVGNLVLDELFGAEVEFVDTDDFDVIYARMRERGAELEKDGHKCCYIPLGGSTALGSVGYVRAAEELAAQAAAAGIRVDHVVCTTGSGGTTAGLALGTQLYLPGAKLTGIGVSEEDFAPLVARLAGETAELLDAPQPFDSSVFSIQYHFGAGYAIANAEDSPYIRELAHSEGILLDPVYTGKAWSKMLMLLREGYFGDAENIVFIHTGGAAALFAMDLG